MRGVELRVSWRLRVALFPRFDNSLQWNVPWIRYHLCISQLFADISVYAKAAAMELDWSAWAPQLATLTTMMRYREYTAVRGLMHGTDALLICSARDAQGELVFSYFLKENKVGVKTLRRIHAECLAAGCHHAILVTEDGVTPFASKELEETARAGNTVEVFKRRELAFCVVEHALVPPHRILTTTERKEFLQRPGYKLSALPRIKSTDPVVRFMNFPLGSIVQISRSIGTSDGEVYYRAVVS